MYFGLEKCSRMCLEKGRVQRKIYIGSTLEKDINELNPREVYLHLGIEDSHDMGHKNEKDKLTWVRCHVSRSKSKALRQSPK